MANSSSTFAPTAGRPSVPPTPLNEVGRWYHVAATFNSSDDTYAIYVDGKLEHQRHELEQSRAAGRRHPLVRHPHRQHRVLAGRDCATFASTAAGSAQAEIADLYGLVGYWELDESSGTSAADSSGAGNNGTVSGTATWNAGRINNAFQFNGSTSINVPSLMGRPKNVTIAAWAKLTTADSSGSEIISLGDSFAIRLDNGGNVNVFFYNGSSWPMISYNQTYAGAGWHHFAAVFDDDHDYYRLYIDGVQRANASTTASISL